MEESNDSSFKLCATAGVDGGRTERLPDNGLTDVGGNEERDTRAKAIAFLEQLIQQEDNQTSTKQLRGVGLWRKEKISHMYTKFLSLSPSEFTPSLSLYTTCLYTCRMMTRQTPAPSSEGGPYIPVIT